MVSTPLQPGAETSTTTWNVLHLIVKMSLQLVKRHCVAENFTLRLSKENGYLSKVKAYMVHS